MARSRGNNKGTVKVCKEGLEVDFTVKYKATAAPIDVSAAPIDASADARNTEITAVVQAVLQAAGLPTKAAANKETKSSGEDHKGIIEEAAGKKRASTATKMQKEAAEWHDCAKAKGKHLHALLEHHYCLQQHCKNKKHGTIYCLEFNLKYHPIQPHHFMH